MLVFMDLYEKTYEYQQELFLITTGAIKSH